MDFLYNIAGIALAVLMVTGAVVWIRNRDGRARAAEEAAELAFERTVGYGATASPSSLTSPPSPPPLMPPPSLTLESRGEQRAGGFDSHSGKVPLSDVAPVAEERPVADSRKMSSGINDTRDMIDGPLVDVIREKLTVAGAFDYDDGPIRSSDPALQGTFLRLKNGKRVAVIESGLAEDSPALHAMLRLVDAAVARGPGGHPLHIKRFEDFLGEILSL